MGDKSTLTPGTVTGVNLGSGLLAGFAAAIVSQPADTMLSKINKTKGMPGESTVSRLVKIAGELGLRGSFAGLPTRLFMVGGLTAGQFAIYGDIKKALGKFRLYLLQGDCPCRPKADSVPEKQALPTVSRSQSKAIVLVCENSHGSNHILDNVQVMNELEGRLGSVDQQASFSRQERCTTGIANVMQHNLTKTRILSEWVLIALIEKIGLQIYDVHSSTRPSRRQATIAYEEWAKYLDSIEEYPRGAFDLASVSTLAFVMVRFATAGSSN
jgi:hypothetical protein